MNLASDAGSSIFSAVVVSAVVSCVVAPCAHAQNRYLGSIGDRNFFCTPVPTTYPNAAAAASAAGGTLATIRSLAEHQYIRDRLLAVFSFPQSDGYWIGLTDVATENVFVWASGEPLTFTLWLPGEPNNSGDFGNEDWTAMYLSGLPGGGGWNDEASTNLHRGIIELCSPYFVQQPSSSRAVLCGDASTFIQSQAAGRGPITYRWYRAVNNVWVALNDDARISGSHTSTLFVSTVASGQTEDYSVVATGPCGSTRSFASRLVGAEPPVVVSGPASATQCGVAPVTFSVVATGDVDIIRPTVYWQVSSSGSQWQPVSLEPLLFSFIIEGEGTSTLTLTPEFPVRGLPPLSFRCVVVNECGSATSSSAMLTSCPADFNCVNGVSVQDIFDFLAAWFARNPLADFNNVNGVTVQDIFDFLAAWFVGCP